jgi:threonine/homoserine/homoserine lactone efflux protein
LNIYFFLKGLIIGFSIAAPVGPIGVLCIRRTLANGRMSGLMSGLGAATADGFYGAVAAFGLTLISNVLVGQQLWFRIIGGSFLLYLGIRTFLSKPSEKSASDKKSNLFGDYISTFILTIMNPITILSFAAVFAGLGLVNSNGNYISALLMVLGVISGSICWWLILSTGVSLLRGKFNPASLKIVNWVSGAIMVVFAVIAFVSIFSM